MISTIWPGLAATLSPTKKNGPLAGAVGPGMRSPAGCLSSIAGQRLGHQRVECTCRG